MKAFWDVVNWMICSSRVRQRVLYREAKLDTLYFEFLVLWNAAKDY